jgi:hypothetical protein
MRALALAAGENRGSSLDRRRGERRFISRIGETLDRFSNTGDLKHGE